MSRVLPLLLVVGAAHAHEFRPARLDLQALGAGRFAATLTVEDDVAGGARLGVTWTGCAVTPLGVGERIGPRETSRWVLDCEPGASARISGPALATIDVFAQVEGGDGSVKTTLLGAGSPVLPLSVATAESGAFPRYLALGVEHILGGYDHLLFVLGLVLLLGGVRPLVGAVTGFTLGHSVTLGAATLGAVTLPSGPVEACIALSVLLLAVELTRPADPPSLARRRPFVLACAFGLLHGFGFAGALAGLGMPQGEVALGLLGFNLGVELGQLAFVAALLLVGRLIPRPLFAGPVPAYALGTVAAFWTLDRVVALT